MNNTHCFPVPSLNPESMAMSAEELVAHLNCHHCMANFANVALVFAVCEHRLMEIEELVRADDKCVDMLWDEIRACEA